jgi:hypothetical protein
VLQQGHHVHDQEGELYFEYDKQWQWIKSKASFQDTNSGFGLVSRLSTTSYAKKPDQDL